jgi:hypothetical protein
LADLPVLELERRFKTIHTDMVYLSRNIQAASSPTKKILSDIQEIEESSEEEYDDEDLTPQAKKASGNDP